MNATRIPPSAAPKVSVVVPAYNAERFIAETLRSVLAQSLRDFEVVVVNDGSTDETVAVVEAVGDERVRIVHKPNGGLSSARNFGVRESRADLIAFVDADDLWLPAKLERQVALLEADASVDVAYCWVELVDEAGRPRNKVLKPTASGRIWRQLLARNPLACGSTPLLRRACLPSDAPFREELTHDEDRDLWLRLAPRHGFAPVPDVLVKYRDSGTGLSKNWRRMLASFGEVNDHFLALEPGLLPENEVERVRARVLAGALRRCAWGAMKDPGAGVGEALRLGARAVARDGYAPAAVAEFARLGAAAGLRIAGPLVGRPYVRSGPTGRG